MKAFYAIIIVAMVTFFTGALAGLIHSTIKWAKEYRQKHSLKWPLSYYLNNNDLFNYCTAYFSMTMIICILVSLTKLVYSLL